MTGEKQEKAIVVVSFGTTYPEARKASSEAIINRIQEKFLDWQVCQAFTSRTVIKRIQEREGLLVETEGQVLERLLAAGVQQILIQPLHIVAGAEYEKIAKAVTRYRQQYTGADISLGRPLLYYTGQEDHPDDYQAVIDAMQEEWQTQHPQEAVLLMGHGGVHPANTAYAALQLKLQDAGLAQVFVHTVEGYPSLAGVMEKLKQHNIDRVRLYPFMLVAGDHAQNDMAGEEEDSVKSQLQAAGFQVSAVVLKGLGEFPAVHQLYLAHIQDMLVDAEYREKR